MEGNKGSLNYLGQKKDPAWLKNANSIVKTINKDKKKMENPIEENKKEDDTGNIKSVN
jgi:hypothetical protein